MADRRHPRGAAKRLTDEQTREMYDLVESAVRPLESSMNTPREAVAAALLVFLAGRDGEARFTQKTYQDALRALRRTSDSRLVQSFGLPRAQTPEWVKPLRLRLADALKRKAREAGAVASRHVVAQAEIVGVDASMVDSDYVEERGQKRLGRRLVAIASEQAEQPYKDIKRRLAIGVAAGLTLAQVVAQMMRAGGRRGPLPDMSSPNAVANAIADATFGIASRSVRRVAVTEIANAYNVQVLVAMDQVGGDVILKRWDASNDRKVCPLCHEMHGRVVELHQAFPLGGGMGPPLHPHCRCALTVWPQRRPTGDVNGD